MKRLIVLGIIVNSFIFSLSAIACAATEFRCVINSETIGDDYEKLSTWENAMDNVGDITASDCKVFSLSSVTTAFFDGDTCIGATSGATGIVIHQTVNGKQILIDAINGTFLSGETINGTGTSNGQAVLKDQGDSAIIVAECYDDDGELNDAVTISGFTTSATNYVKITAPPTERHTGMAGTGFVLRPYSGTAAIRIEQKHTVVEWLEINCSSISTGVFIGYYSMGPNSSVVVRNCIIHSGSTHGVEVYYSQDNYILNCIIYGFNIGIESHRSPQPTYIYNCTVYNCTTAGIQGRTDRAGQDFTAKNTVCMNNGTDFSDVVSCDYLVSSDGTAATFATNNAINKTDYSSYFESIAMGRENLHLKNSSDNLWGLAGINLGTANGVNIDIDGVDRNTNNIWDIGADSYGSSQPPAGPSRTIGFQGRLEDSYSTPLNGLFNINFRIYDSETTGTHIWEETQDIEIKDGLLDAELGKVIPLDLLFDKQYYLGLEVESDGEMQPRFKLKYVPYSFKAVN